MRRGYAALCAALFALCALLPGAASATATFTDTTYELDPVATDAPLGVAPEATRAPADDAWPRTIIVTVGGDCTLGCTDAQRARDVGFEAVIAEKGLDWPFSALSAVFSQDDLTLVNFEGTLTASTDKTEGKQFNFKGPTAYARMLTLGSVEAVNLANNHFHDYGEAGKADTLAALEAEGIVRSAEGAPAIFETRGVKIGLIGNTFSYRDGKRDITKDVQALREAGCQIVIASFHWGSEYETDFSRDQRNIGRAAIDAGADVVVGHHPHIIQGIEPYEGRYILYSLGNLVFGGNTDPDDRDTYVAALTFTVPESGNTQPPALRVIPVRLTERADGTDYRPVPVQPGETYDAILRKVLNRSSGMEGFVNPAE